jgi:hypothetical protein
VSKTFWTEFVCLKQSACAVDVTKGGLSNFVSDEGEWHTDRPKNICLLLGLLGPSKRQNHRSNIPGDMPPPPPPSHPTRDVLTGATVLSLYLRLPFCGRLSVFRFPAREKLFCSPDLLGQLLCSPSVYRLKRPELYVDHWLISKNERSSTAACLVCCHGMDRDIFTFSSPAVDSTVVGKWSENRAFIK